MKLRSLLIVFALIIITSSCFAPKTFIKTMEPTWTTIELHEDVSFDEAWKETLDILIRKFDIEISQKENGYIRTGWLYTWTGKYTSSYRVRVTVKFHQDKGVVEIKSEAYYKGRVGFDNRLLQTVKTDIMGTIGRTTR
ncbi:MAG: hypothetical protein K8R35_11070 [Bacteroidales bacterium]|nr:hypothetical protein [Bacteroidales bacterium]